MLRRIRELNESHTSDDAFNEYIAEDVYELLSDDDWSARKRTEIFDDILYDTGNDSMLYFYRDPSYPVFLRKFFDELRSRLADANIEVLKQQVSGLRRAIARSRRAATTGDRNWAVSEETISEWQIRLDDLVNRIRIWKVGQNTMFDEYAEWIRDEGDQDEEPDQEWDDQEWDDGDRPIGSKEKLEEYTTGILDSEAGKHLIVKHEIENNARYYEDSFRDSEDIHFDIDEELREFEAIIRQAESPNADQDDLDELVAAIDHIVDLSHHGGPLLEYTLQTEPKGEPDPIEMMHRKWGKGFLPYAVQQGFVPRDSMELANEAERQRAAAEHERSLGGSSAEIARIQSRDDYYRDPYVSNQGTYAAQHASPSMAEIRDTPPGEAARINTQNVLWDSAARMRDVPGNRWSPEAMRLRMMHDWAARDTYERWARQHGRPMNKSRMVVR